MRISRLAVAAVAALVLAAAVAASAQAQVTLRYNLQPGRQRTVERLERTELMLSGGDRSRQSITELPSRRQELVVEVEKDPPAIRVVRAETPVGLRTVKFEENGKDMLANVPENQRLRPVPPTLSKQTIDLRGRLKEMPEKTENPTQAIEMAQVYSMMLPEQPVKPGDTWTEEFDLGLAKASLKRTFKVQKTDSGVDAAVIESTGALVFTGDLGQRITVEKMTGRLVFAMDGSGMVSASTMLQLVEKAEGQEQRVQRNIEEKLIDSTVLDAAAIEKARKDLDQLEKAVQQAQAKDIDGGLQTLETFLKENPDSPWAPAVQNLHTGLTQQRMLTQPVPAARLRLMLQDLQSNRDQAGSRGNSQQLEQIDRTLRQVATVNSRQVMEDSRNPDPVIRDLATFALAFMSQPEVADRLAELVKDASAQVVGTAVIGLAIHGKALDEALLMNLLKAPDVRVRGAAALLAARTIKPDDPAAIRVLPSILDALKAEQPLTRMNSLSAIVTLAPKGSKEAVRALIEAHKAEKEEGLKPIYIEAMKRIAGLEADDLAAYEKWLAAQPAGASPAAPVAPKAETPKVPAETPKAPAEKPTPKG